MKKFLIIILFITYFSGFSQDPIHTQFFMIPETLSSSFTGAKQSTRAGIIHRTQWPGLNFSINTQFAFVDNWFEEVNSGVGISVLNHKETTTRYNFTQVNLNYAYQVKGPKTIQASLYIVSMVFLAHTYVIALSKRDFM
jgi:type IX secretion system PorP/SprF family membrane protein